ncbi:MAG TPA: ornithine cyclodeaminase family protein, partial [Vicinamibacteria bacterium]|nr:ornithine cyclodeaminase family protein [Vicinamibacteria bacterium]
RSQVVVTCTTAHAPLFSAADVPPGALVAAVGADNPTKQELDPRLLGRGAVVVDSIDQCAAYGELRHALAAGALSRDAVRAELADVVAGTRPGRLSAEEIVVFDSTGTALQDVAAAAWVYESALGAGKGVGANLSGDSGVTSRHT